MIFAYLDKLWFWILRDVIHNFAQVFQIAIFWQNWLKKFDFVDFSIHNISLLCKFGQLSLGKRNSWSPEKEQSYRGDAYLGVELFASWGD